MAGARCWASDPLAVLEVKCRLTHREARSGRDTAPSRVPFDLPHLLQMYKPRARRVAADPRAHQLTSLDAASRSRGFLPSIASC